MALGHSKKNSFLSLILSKMIKRLVLFLILNFGALALGSFFTADGVASDWYQNLNKAPWTPPGWVFGFAWTLIMICFSIFMAKAVDVVKQRKLLIGLFLVQWLFNILWNPLFFYFKNVLLAFILIVALFTIVEQMMIRFKSELNNWRWLILPYVFWLAIAISLNAYAQFMN